MAIPPIPGSPSAANYDDLLTGTSSTFRSSNGNWVNSGGTLTYDTTIAYMWPSNNTGSAKLVTTASSQYVECPVTGTFKVGVEYQAFIVVTVEENVDCDFSLLFGLIGTDAVTLSPPAFGTYEQWNGGRFAAFMLRWIPTATRTGVKVRLNRLAGPTGTITYHVSHCKVFRALPLNTVPLIGTPATNAAAAKSGMALHYDNSTQWTRLSNGTKDGGLELDSFLGATLVADSGNTPGYAGMGVSGGADGYAWVQADYPTAGDLGDKGFNVEVGTDYVGFYVSERDSNTVQMYSDVAAGYMMQLRNRGTNKGWAVSDDGTLNQKITDTFQWPFYVAGAQTTGTNKAAYFQVPEKCRIDEVRIHLGTAPTGSSFIVDVNDDGTTIFTSQGNRPEIAISGTDDTSGAADGGTAVAKDSVLTIDVDQIGSTIAGSDLVVFVRGRFIW